MWAFVNSASSSLSGFRVQDLVLKRNPQQKLGLVLVTVQETVGIEKMFRAPARVADFGRDMDHQRLDIQADAEHVANGVGLVEFRRRGRSLDGSRHALPD